MLAKDGIENVDVGHRGFVVKTTGSKVSVIWRGQEKVMVVGRRYVELADKTVLQVLGYDDDRGTHFTKDKLLWATIKDKPTSHQGRTQVTNSKMKELMTMEQATKIQSTLQVPKKVIYQASSHANLKKDTTKAGFSLRLLKEFISDNTVDGLVFHSSSQAYTSLLDIIPE